ncbi:hypothetical protein [Oceaniglobus ichthyenteri]|uniref:hypothetical protein n=1 Tax=Oceaniglobus ichthyenteri TaxID=2136177 RepID=UPI000D34290B|nr:hypothetical protein [Oceaniglobus ichthyenteri]
MSLIRPELRAALWPWREALLGGAITLWALYWIISSPGLLRWIGVALLIGGAALAMQGIQRARFPSDGDGPGVVEVDERQITYFGPGPGGGAAISIDALVRVEFATRPTRQWLFHSDGSAPLSVPSDAAGADALFDALSALPGFDTQSAIRAARSNAPAVTPVWQRDRLRLH